MTISPPLTNAYQSLEWRKKERSASGVRQRIRCYSKLECHRPNKSKPAQKKAKPSERTDGPAILSTQAAVAGVTSQNSERSVDRAVSFCERSINLTHSGPAGNSAEIEYRSIQDGPEGGQQTSPTTGCANSAGRSKDECTISYEQYIASLLALEAGTSSSPQRLQRQPVPDSDSSMRSYLDQLLERNERKSCIGDSYRYSELVHTPSSIGDHRLVVHLIEVAAHRNRALSFDRRRQDAQLGMTVGLVCLGHR